ncbi:Dabb family protein [Paenibacillus sp. FSL H8-0332]|uniref:Dabb family protein n=1 Tax=Paenibacillus sp. FSL H8-0332 TaxID=2954742 RepID=UPI0030CABCE0
MEAEANVRPGPSAYDLILITKFASLEDMDEYLIHPAHQEVARWMGTVLEIQASVCCSI